MRRFIIGLMVTGVTLALQPLPGIAEDVAKAHREKISTIGSERATSGYGNKIATAGGKTRVWQDATKEGYFARVRSLDHETGNWSATYTLGEGRDNIRGPQSLWTARATCT